MLTVDDARALITTSLSDTQLADVIDREEAWLARRIGPLDGQRVETFVSEDGDEVLHLQRPAGPGWAVEDEGGDRTADVRLSGWSDIVGSAWRSSIAVTYEPVDGPEVTRALVTLVRLTVAETAFTSESAGGYSSATDIQQQRTTRWAAWHGLLRPRRPSTTRIAGSLSNVEAVKAVSVVALGS
jgi:hypothetical protein